VRLVAALAARPAHHCRQGQAMTAIRISSARFGFSFFALIVSLFVLLALPFSPARAADLPDDDEQDVLIRSTLMTFNDANMTGNYSVLLAKAAPQFQAQFTAEKLAASFETFRKTQLFFEDVVTADYDSYEKAKLDGEGALVLAGALKTDELTVKYKLRFAKSNKVWKMIGLDVDAKQ
jgi:hypothetical protein